MAKKFDLAELMGGKAAEAVAQVSDSDTVVRLPVEELHGNEGNFYVVDDVKDLCDSIAVSGVLQPILARPRTEGGYTVIAGHRRIKAVRQLREEWKGKGENPWDTVPAILRPAPATRAEELLEDLALITTNSAARKLTDPELSQQAEKLADILYGLKQEGYEFPGRMRKVVAEALGVSETKLARQKTIREKLSPAWLERWKAGKCPEYAAEALAKLAPEVQDAMLFMKEPTPARVGDLAAYHAKCFKEHGCTVRHGEPCTWGEHFWNVGSRKAGNWERCCYYASPQCCGNCNHVLKCGQACPLAAEKAKKDKKRQAEEQKKAAEREKQKEAAGKKSAETLWRRFKALREAAGVTLGELEKTLREQGIYARYAGNFESREDLREWQVTQTPEGFLSFKGVYLCTQIFGCPLAALTNVDWTPEQEAGGGLEAGDGREDSTRMLPQSPAGDSSLPEGARTGDEGRETEERIATGGKAALAMTGDGGAGQWPEWISVEDALPEALVDVLALNEDGGIVLAHRTRLGDWINSLNARVTHWMPKPPLPGADRTLPGTACWRPYPKTVPSAGTRALVVQKQGAYERLVFEAKLAKFDGNAWTWVSEVIPDVEAERVEWWLPEPRFPEMMKEADDEADPDE